MRTGILLAGGRGTRMGAFKPLLAWQGRPLLHRALDALAPHCAERIVMAGDRAADVSRVADGARVLADPVEGPHVALALAARVARHEELLVAPADMPHIDAAVFAPLFDAGAPAIFALDGVPNPLVGFYARDALREALAARPRSLQVAARAMGARLVDGAPLRTRLADADEPLDLR